METEYIVQTADTGEYTPLLASDKYDALQKAADVPVEALYMQSSSPDAAFSDAKKYAYHLIRLKDGTYFVLEESPQPVDKDEVDKVYVNVELRS